jgi:hypothetical protein
MPRVSSYRAVLKRLYILPDQFQPGTSVFAGHQLSIPQVTIVAISMNRHVTENTSSTRRRENPRRDGFYNCSGSDA